MRTFALIASLAVYAAAQENDAAAEVTIFDMDTPSVISFNPEGDDMAMDGEGMEWDANMEWDEEKMDDMMDESEMQAAQALKMAKDLMDIFCGEEMDDHWEMDNDEKWEEDNAMVDGEMMPMEGDGEGRRLQEGDDTMVGEDESTWSPNWDEAMPGADEGTWSPTWDENGNPIWGDDDDMMMGMNNTMMDMDDLCMQARTLWNEANEYHMADEEGRKQMEDAWSSMIEAEIKAWFEGAAAITASATIVAAVATLAF